MIYLANDCQFCLGIIVSYFIRLKHFRDLVLSFQLCADVLVNAGQLLESLHDLVRRIRKNLACNRTADHPSLSAV